MFWLTVSTNATLILFVPDLPVSWMTGTTQRKSPFVLVGAQIKLWLMLTSYLKTTWEALWHATRLIVALKDLHSTSSLLITSYLPRYILGRLSLHRSESGVNALYIDAPYSSGTRYGLISWNCRYLSKLLDTIRMIFPHMHFDAVCSCTMLVASSIVGISLSNRGRNCHRDKSHLSKGAKVDPVILILFELSELMQAPSYPVQWVSLASSFYYAVTLPSLRCLLN